MRTSAAMKHSPAPRSAPTPRSGPRPIRPIKDARPETHGELSLETRNGARKSTSSEQRNEIREVMDIRQAANYLGISSDTLYKYASEGFVPAFKLGNRWRFKKSRLDEWMDRQSDASMAHPEAPPTSPHQKKPVRAAR